MSARIESKRMTNHNTPQFSRMDLANHCAASPGLSLLNTRAVRGVFKKHRIFDSQKYIYIYKNECLYVCLSRMRSYTIHPIAMKLR
jgi:hypothetical protein